MNAVSNNRPWAALVSGCFLFCMVSQPTRANDWPMFRGAPNLTGVAQGNLPEKPVSIWTFKTGGAVKSSAAIVQNHVFIGSTDENIYALELSNGKKLWTLKTGGPV